MPTESDTVTLEQTDLATLNDRWAVEGLLRFEPGAGDLPRAVLTTAGGDTAHVYLHGAHITHYQPAGCKPGPLKDHPEMNL